MIIKNIELPKQMHLNIEMTGAFHPRFTRLIILSAALCLIFLAAGFIQYRGITFKEAMSGIFILGIYGILVVSFLLRISLVFFGVFAIYRIAAERVRK